MADIKREDITLSDRTKGISADEFAGGSYFYSDGIQTGYSTKGFKLGPYLNLNILNERNGGRPMAVCPCKGSILSDSNNIIYFTRDRRLEMQGSLNGSTYGEGGEHGGGAIFSDTDLEGFDRYGGYVYGDYALVFLDDFIRKINYKQTYNPAGQTVVNPRFENDAGGWTVGTGWTLTDDGMKHTTGNTGTLSTTALGPTGEDTTATGRFAIKVTGCTAGNVVLNWNGDDVITTEATKNGWFVGYGYNVQDGASYTLTVTPSSDFNGNVEAVNFNVYRDSAIETEISGLTEATKHMAMEWGGDIYITSGNTIDILSTVDWKISDSKKLIRDDESIVAITQQADSLIIWATNGIDSHQYYWNGVDSIASECIEWKGEVIKGVTGTEVVSYVLAGVGGALAGYAYRLYSVNGYQRSLIASNAYKVEGNQWNLEHFHPSKKFAFNDVEGSQSMCMFLDNLYLPGCDGIYQFGQTIPGLSHAWSRPINYQNGAEQLFLYQDGIYLGFTYFYNGKQYYVSVQNDRYTDYGYLVTDSLYWDKLGTRKALEKIKLGYKNIASEDGQINVYAIVDDDYFWRFDATGISTRPKIGDIYEVADDTTAELILIDKQTATKGTLTFRTVNNGGSLYRAYKVLERVEGEGDATIETNNNYDNMILLKSILSDQQGYGSDFIFGKDFVNNYMPYRHKIQFVIELVKNNTYRNAFRTPEIYELSFISDITDTIL